MTTFRARTEVFVRLVPKGHGDCSLTFSSLSWLSHLGLEKKDSPLLLYSPLLSRKLAMVSEHLGLRKASNEGKNET